MPLDDRQRRTSLVAPILLIALGAFFLFKAWHPEFEAYPVLRTYWPLILILVGLGKIWDSSRSRAAGRTSSGVALGSTLGVVAFVLVLVILLGHYQKSRQRFTRSEGESYASHSEQVVELGGAKSVSATLRLGAGQLNVSGGSSHLLNSQFHFDRKWDSPKVEYRVVGGKGELEIGQEKSGGINFGATDNTWDLDFNNDVPLSLRIDMGAGQGNLKLRDLDLTEVELHMGAGQVEVELPGPRTSDLNVSIKGGVGQATIRVPKNVGVVAHAAGGIGSITADGWKKDGSEYRNDSYGKTTRSIKLDVQGGIGEIEFVEE
jgi:hypothetical protein